MLIGETETPQENKENIGERNQQSPEIRTCFRNLLLFFSADSGFAPVLVFSFLLTTHFQTVNSKHKASLKYSISEESESE